MHHYLLASQMVDATFVEVPRQRNQGKKYPDQREREGHQKTNSAAAGEKCCRFFTSRGVNVKKGEQHEA